MGGRGVEGGGWGGRGVLGGFLFPEALRQMFVVRELMRLWVAWPSMEKSCPGTPPPNPPPPPPRVLGRERGRFSPPFPIQHAAKVGGGP